MKKKHWKTMSMICFQMMKESLFIPPDALKVSQNITQALSGANNNL